MKFPLIIWGENSAFEYSGLGDESTGFKLNSEWLKNFGVTHGTTAKDWISDNLTLKELTPYFGPTPEELEKCGTLAVFLGYYFAWDVETTKGVAQANGFQGSIDGCPKTGIYDFADIDDDFIVFTTSLNGISLDLLGLMIIYRWKSVMGEFLEIKQFKCYMKLAMIHLKKIFKSFVTL